VQPAQACEEVDFAPQRLRVAQQGFAALDHDATETGGHGPLRGSIEQAHTERLLELGDSARQGRLRQAERFGGGYERPVLRQGGDKSDTAEVSNRPATMPISAPLRAFPPGCTDSPMSVNRSARRLRARPMHRTSRSSSVHRSCSRHTRGCGG
jgi:hypothetical protein